LPASADASSRIAFVTGGTGFVGSHLVEELLQRGYNEVRCLVRSRQKWLQPFNITPVRGDLSDIEMLWDAVRDVDIVYHVAGLTRAQEWGAFYQANVQATLNLMGALRHSNPDVGRVLITSSLAAVGRCANGVATEETPLQPISMYGRSKAEMEEALRAKHEMRASYAEQLPITVVRPPAVYGPRDRDILTFFQTVKRHVCPVVGRGDEPALSLVHVRDLVRGMVDAAEHDVTVGETYFVGSEAAYSWNDVKAATTSALDTWALTLPVPGALVGAVGAAAEAWGALTGSYPPLNREKAREIRHACTICSVEKAQADFGYAQRIPLSEGVRETIEWYENEGWL
jgi:nucleoside-diphosphate-sugar epimerase